MMNKKYDTQTIRQIVLYCIFTISIFSIVFFTIQNQSITNSSTVSFLFLIVIVLASAFSNLIVAILVCAESALCFNYFFLPPIGTFSIAAFSDWIALIAFLATAIVISTIGKIAIRRRTIIRSMSTHNESLLRFSKWLYRIPEDKLSLTAIAAGITETFPIDYCSIRNLGEGNRNDSIGQAKKTGCNIPLGAVPDADHSADLAGTINEYDLNVCYITVRENPDNHLLFAYKTANLDREFLTSLSYVTSIRLHELISAQGIEAVSRQGRAHASAASSCRIQA